MADVLLVEQEVIRGAFREWQAEHETLDAQLAESLAALSAYQSHLDGWQQQLARERDELRTSRDEFERQRAETELAQSQLQQSSAENSAELGAAREKITSLSTSLLERTEQLRDLDQRRADMVTELEQARARELEFSSALDEQKRALEAERARWTEETQQLRELLEHRPEASATNGANSTQELQTPGAASRPAPQNQVTELPGPSPVLGSIMQQFGKLRQQRAVDREALRKAR